MTSLNKIYLRLVKMFLIRFLSFLFSFVSLPQVNIITSNSTLTLTLHQHFYTCILVHLQTRPQMSSQNDNGTNINPLLRGGDAVCSEVAVEMTCEGCVSTVRAAVEDVKVRVLKRI